MLWQVKNKRKWWSLLLWSVSSMRTVCVTYRASYVMYTLLFMLHGMTFPFALVINRISLGVPRAITLYDSHDIIFHLRVMFRLSFLHLYSLQLYQIDHSTQCTLTNVREFSLTKGDGVELWSNTPFTRSFDAWCLY